MVSTQYVSTMSYDFDVHSRITHAPYRHSVAIGFLATAVACLNRIQ